jgi:hypothetical protein
LAAEIRIFVPGLSAIVADPQATARAPPSSYINRIGISSIHDDVVEDKIVCAIKLGKTMPVRSAIERLVNPTGSCT